MANEYVLVPRELLANYAAEYDAPVPDYTLRSAYRQQLFALLSTPPSGDREAVLEEQRDLWKARYDLVRGLSVPDFASLFIRCVTLDKRFDDEVDKMIAARTALKHKDAKS